MKNGNMEKTIPEEDEDLITIISSDEVLRQQLVSDRTIGDGGDDETRETLPLLLKSGMHRPADCSCFAFVIQGIVVLEIVSLLFYVTLLLYSTRLKNIDRNRDAVVLFLYVLTVMSYGIFSLQIRFRIGIKILAAIVKAFASSVFFAFSLEHTMLLPAFFFYFFPAIISTSINIVLS